MKILYGSDFCFDEPTAITIGKFDGVHEGHVKIINTLIELAKKHNIKSLVYTFETNPKCVLEHDGHFVPLMSNAEKSCALERLGVDFLVYENFDEEFSKMSPQYFVENVLVKKLNVKAVVMGDNSTFGRDRSGDAKLMLEFGKKYGFDVVVVSLLRKDGEIISSSKLRKKLLKKVDTNTLIK